MRPAAVPHYLTQLQRRRCRHRHHHRRCRHTHYSGSADTHKESTATAGIIAATPCLQHLSLPDEATKHHKRFCNDDCVTAVG